MQLDETYPFKLSFFTGKPSNREKINKKIPIFLIIRPIEPEFSHLYRVSGTISIHHQMQPDEISPFKLPTNLPTERKLTKKFRSSSQFHSLNRHFHTFTRFVAIISIHHQMQLDEISPFKLSFFTDKPSKREKINEKIRIFDPLNRHFYTFTNFACKI